MFLNCLILTLCIYYWRETCIIVRLRIKGELASEWLLFNTNSAIVRLYYGENKFSMKWGWGPLCTNVLYQHD